MMLAAKFTRSPRLPAALLTLATLLIASAPAFASPAQQHDHTAASGVSSVCTASRFGKVHHPVNTSNPQAQRLFEQAMALDYGFNHGQAEQCFREAARLDPNMPMAYWGIALVLGTNYNLPVDDAREKLAYENVQKALALSANAPRNERDYIQALAKRYTDAASSRLRSSRSRLPRRDARRLSELPRRSRCRDAFCRKRHEPPSLAALRSRRPTRARHG